MFRTWSLKGKLFGVFSTSVLFLALVGSMSYYMLGYVVNGFLHVTRVNFPNEVLLATMNDARQDIVIEMMILTDISSTPQQVQESQAEFVRVVDEFMKAGAEYEKIPFVDGEEALWNDVLTTRTAYLESANRIFSMSSQRDAANIEAMDRLVRDVFTPRRIELRRALNDLKNFQRNEARSRTTYAENQADNAQLMILFMVFAGFSVTMSLSFFFARNISMVLSRLASELSGGASEVAAAATQISSTSEELSSAATEQAASLQETAASIEEMSAMIRRNTDNAMKSKETTNESEQTAVRGKKVVDEMVAAINAIDESNQEISAVVKVISDIGAKTKVINDIVFKTQLLSFNASVEAARAGEHGKGFAVVAEEVGNLARMSGDAANQISNVLDESITSVQAMINRSKEKVNSGIAISNRCRDVLDDIVRDISDINGMAEQISVASDEQSRGVDEITSAMSQLDQVTQQNAASSQQASSAAEQLSTQAESLRSIVNELFATVNGGRASEQTNAATYQTSVQHTKPKISNTSGKLHSSEKSHQTKQLKKLDDLNVPDGEDSRFREAS